MPVESDVDIVDPLSGNTYTVKRRTDKTGQRVYGVSSPVLKAKGAKAAIDDEYLKDFNAWTAGGRTKSELTKANLESALAKLRDPKTQASGPIVGTLASTPVVGEIGARIFAPDMFRVRDQILTEGQNMIKTIFGSNPAQQEAQRLLDRLFDIKQPEGENAERVQRFLNVVNGALEAGKAKEAHFNRYGTLANYKGPDLQDIVAANSKPLQPAEPSAPAALAKWAASKGSPAVK